LEEFLNSEAIIVGLGLLFLVVAFFLFKSQIFILLNRLAKIEFRNAGNAPIATETIVRRDPKPWTWFQAWTNSLIHRAKMVHCAQTSSVKAAFSRPAHQRITPAVGCA
jgi:hypothetical protein